MSDWKKGWIVTVINVVITALNQIISHLVG